MGSTQSPFLKSDSSSADSPQAWGCALGFDALGLSMAALSVVTESKTDLFEIKVS